MNDRYGSPILTIRSESNAGLRLHIWERTLQNGRPALTTRLEFKYWNKQEQRWTNKGQLFESEVVELTRMLLRAIKWMCERNQQPYPQDLIDFTSAFQVESSSAYPVSDYVSPDDAPRNRIMGTLSVEQIAQENFDDFEEPL